ncbi:hypothetical protein GOODEAATRI_020728, partial [Goodea atripinnis]
MIARVADGLPLAASIQEDEQGVCCLCLCEASFPKKMAFGYLEDLHNEFYEQYGRRVPTVTRPYSFIEF